ncbi:MAG: hypothetical protein KC910_29320 [Candidatus Eremiobacteraeota bacterium]|nr:hypothetical protein [Candidatus Eremiobacteraeota bacterium]
MTHVTYNWTPSGAIPFGKDKSNRIEQFSWDQRGSAGMAVGIGAHQQPGFWASVESQKKSAPADTSHYIG